MKSTLTREAIIASAIQASADFQVISETIVKLSSGSLTITTFSAKKWATKAEIVQGNNAV